MGPCDDKNTNTQRPTYKEIDACGVMNNGHNFFLPQ